LPRFGILLLLMCGCGSPTKPEPLYLGHLAATDQNDSELHGVAMAVDELNADAEQRPLGRRILAIHAEVSSNPADYESQSVRLGTVNRVSALLGGSTASRSERVSRADQSDQLPFFSTAGWSGSRFNSAVFHLGLDPAQQGIALARYARDSLNVTRVCALVDSREPIFAEQFNAFRNEWQKKDTAFLREVQYATVDSRSELAHKVSSTNPTAVLIAGRAVDVAELRANLTEAGVKADVPILFASEELDLLALKLSPEPSEGIITTTAFVADLERESVQAFVKKHREKYHSEPNALTALSYEGVRMWSAAVKSSQLTELKKIRDELLKSPGLDVLTGTLTFTKEHQARRPVFIVRIEKGVAKRVHTFEKLD